VSRRSILPGGRRHGEIESLYETKPRAERLHAELCARRAPWSDRTVPPWTRSGPGSEREGEQPPAGRWQAWAFGLLLLAAGLHCLRPLWGDDLFWQLANGRLILATHALPEHDPFTYTAIHPPVHDEWLSEVLLAAAERSLGLGGLRLLCCGLFVAGLALLWLLAPDRSPAPSPERAAPARFALVAVAWMGALPNASLRPHAVAWPVAVAVLAGIAPRAVAAWDRGRGWRPRLLWLAALWLGTVVWINLHSSALIVPALLAVTAAGAVVDWLLVDWLLRRSGGRGPVSHCPFPPPPRFGRGVQGSKGGGSGLRTLAQSEEEGGRGSGRLVPSRSGPWVAAAVALAACAMQPAGLGLLPYVEQTLRINVVSEEWQPLLTLDSWRTFPSAVLGWWLLLATTLAAGIAEWRPSAATPAADIEESQASAAMQTPGVAEPRRPVPASFPGFWASLACLYLAAEHRRMVLFYFVPALWLAPRLVAVWTAASRRSRRLLAATAVAAAMVLAFVELPDALARGPLRAGLYPQQATAFLAATDLDGRLFHDLGWGGYLELYRFPRQQVFADGRWLLGGPEMLRDYRAMYGREGPRQEIDLLFARWRVAALLQSTQAFAAAPPLDAERWALAWIDPTAIVLLRRDQGFAERRRRVCAFYGAHPELAFHGRSPRSPTSPSWPPPTLRPTRPTGPTGPPGPAAGAAAAIPAVLDECRAGAKPP